MLKKTKCQDHNVKKNQMKLILAVNCRCNGNFFPFKIKPKTVFHGVRCIYRNAVIYPFKRKSCSTKDQSTSILRRPMKNWNEKYRKKTYFLFEQKQNVPWCSLLLLLFILQQRKKVTAPTNKKLWQSHAFNYIYFIVLSSTRSTFAIFSHCAIHKTKVKTIESMRNEALFLHFDFCFDFKQAIKIDSIHVNRMALPFAIFTIAEFRM